jgi:hypothetical protein
MQALVGSLGRGFPAPGLPCSESFLGEVLIDRYRCHTSTLKEFDRLVCAQ